MDFYLTPACSPTDLIHCTFNFLQLHPAVMKEFSHPNIIQLFGWTMLENDYFILMELAPFGEVSGDVCYLVYW